MTMTNANAMPRRYPAFCGHRRPACRISGRRRSLRPPPEHPDLQALGHLGRQRLEIVALHFFPLFVETHDRVGRHGDLIARGAGKAPDEDGFELLPIEQGHGYDCSMCTVKPPTNIANPIRPIRSPAGSMIIVTPSPRPSTMSTNPAMTNAECSRRPRQQPAIDRCACA